MDDQAKPDDQGVTFEEATGGQATPVQQQTAPAPPGEEGRQVIVHARPPPPKPPPAPIPPHEAAPLSVTPNVAAPSAVGQKPPPPAPKEDEGVPFEQVAPPAYPGWKTDIGKGAWGGLAEGAEGIAGLPHDAPNLVDYGLAWASAHLAQAAGGPSAEESLKKTHGSYLRLVAGDDAADALEKFSPTANWPGAAKWKGWAKQAGVDPDYTPQSIGGRYAHEIAAFLPGAALPIGEAGLLTRLGQSVLPAVGSETLGNAVKGGPLEPWARFVGAGAFALPEMAARAVAPAAREWAAPAFKGNWEDLAAQRYQAQAANPAAAAGNIKTAQAQRAPNMATGENIPGSKPTTAQLADDPGLVEAERELQKENPALWAQRSNAQRAAQTKALRNVEPVGGAPEAISDLITKRLQQIDQKHEAQVEMARQMHEVGQQAHEQGVAQAEAAAKGEAGQVARKGAPEALGARARAAIAKSMAERRAEEKALWDKIGADKIGVRPHQIGGQARRIQRAMGEMQKSMEGEEKEIFDKAAAFNIKDVRKLSDITDLTSRLKTAMRAERMTNGKTPALARMAELLRTSENVIKNAATRQSAKEAEQDMGRLRAMTPQDRANMMAARAASRARGDIERGPAGGITRQGATADSYRTMESQVPGKVFAKGPTGYQKAKAYADATGEPWLDPFKDIVSNSMAEHATTNGMIDRAKLAKWQEDYGDALRALPDDVREKYVKGPAEAAAQLAETAAQRRASMIAHQKNDVAKQIGKSPADILRRDSALNGLEGMTSPKDVQNKVGSIMERGDAVRTMQTLAQHVAGNPNAEAGLRTAALDHVIKRIVSETKVGDEKALKVAASQAYIRDKRAALKAAGLSDPQLDMLDRIAGDVERQQAFYSTSTRQSPTAPLLYKQLKAASAAHNNLGWVGKLIALKEGVEGLESLGVKKWVAATAGLPVAAATGWIQHARNAGMESINDILREAVMNPDVGERLLSKPPKIPGRGTQATLGEHWRRHAMMGALAAERHMALDQRGAPGRDVYVRKSGALQ